MIFLKTKKINKNLKKIQMSILNEIYGLIEVKRAFDIKNYMTPGGTLPSLGQIINVNKFVESMTELINAA